VEFRLKVFACARRGNKAFQKRNSGNGAAETDNVRKAIRRMRVDEVRGSRDHEAAGGAGGAIYEAAMSRHGHKNSGFRSEMSEARDRIAAI